MIIKRELINIECDLDEVLVDEPVLCKKCRLYDDHSILLEIEYKNEQI